MIRFFLLTTMPEWCTTSIGNDAAWVSGVGFQVSGSRFQVSSLGSQSFRLETDSGQPTPKPEDPSAPAMKPETLEVRLDSRPENRDLKLET